MYCPVAAELLAVSVSKLGPVVGFGKKDAVTPLGRPEAADLALERVRLESDTCMPAWRGQPDLFADPTVSDLVHLRDALQAVPQSIITVS